MYKFFTYILISYCLLFVIAIVGYGLISIVYPIQYEYSISQELHETFIFLSKYFGVGVPLFVILYKLIN